MDKSFELTILNSQEEIYSGKVELVQMLGHQGMFTVLKNHGSMVSAIYKGKIRIVDSGQNESFFDTDGGILEVSNNKSVILLK